MRKITLFAILILAGCASSCGGGGNSSEPAPIPVAAFMGDSITAWWPLGSCLQNATIVNAGVPGEDTAHMQARFQTDVMAKHPTTVHILGGANDIVLTTMPTTDAIYAMAATAKNNGVRVLLGTIWQREWSGYPDAALRIANTNAWNESIKAMAKTYGFTVVDYAAAMQPDGTWNPAVMKDGVHPNDAGYAVMCKALLQAQLGSSRFIPQRESA